RARWLAVLALLVGIALAPIEVTALSMYGVGNHAEGFANDMLLLALFASRWPWRSPRHAALGWALVGFALYLNKGTLLVAPLLAVAELGRSWRQPMRLAAVAAGALVGLAPELFVLAQRHGTGWATMATKVERTAPAFPRLLVDDLLTLGEYRWELLAWWAIAVGVGVALLARAWRARRAGAPAPLALALVVAVVGFHLAALGVMAQGGFDAYAIYSYPALCVLMALTVAAADAQASARWGERSGAAAGGAVLALTVLLAWPHAANGGAAVGALWRNQAGAACSWRFAEGFGREWQYGLARPGQSREAHVIARCRSLTDADQRLDCIGGMARELHWRLGGRIDGAPPAALDASERRAYAYHYGTHRKGDASSCGDFADAALAATCADAVRLECLVFADQLQRIVGGQGLAAPGCALPEPPMDGYWAERRRDLLARAGGSGPSAPIGDNEGELSACQPVFDDCYPAGASR
ncbi:MAG TPA: hypothetical protein VL049_22600, partial [Candidatus Dormibacteraeota bacterium]|nr:hypothetical protein [Candidatus Dormibacteraeota bacterium]